MTQAYESDITLTGSAVDLVATYGAMGGASAYVQNKGPRPVLVSFTSSASAPAGGYIVLQPGEMTYGTAAHVWAKSLGGDAAVAVGLTG